MRRTKSEIYLDAAERIFDERNAFACTAIEMAAGFTRVASKEFQDYFMPENEISGIAWFGSSISPQNRLARQLALLLMVEITKEK